MSCPPSSIGLDAGPVTEGMEVTNQRVEMSASVAHVHHGLIKLMGKGLPCGKARMEVVDVDSTKGRSDLAVVNNQHLDDAQNTNT
jgi:hypothetical protein